jgi:hypothetical protein
MTAHDLIAACRARGISLEVRGDQLRCRAPVGIMTPQLKQALAAQKAALVQIFMAEAPALAAPKLPDDRTIIAVKVWSGMLSEAIWVVADNLPRDEWPRETAVYTHAEVKWLRQVGPDTLEWVHASKQMLGARVMRAAANHERNRPDGGDA